MFGAFLSSHRGSAPRIYPRSLTVAQCSPLFHSDGLPQPRSEGRNYNPLGAVLSQSGLVTGSSSSEGSFLAHANSPHQSLWLTSGHIVALDIELPGPMLETDLGAYLRHSPLFWLTGGPGAMQSKSRKYLQCSHVLVSVISTRLCSAKRAVVVVDNPPS